MRTDKKESTKEETEMASHLKLQDKLLENLDDIKRREKIKQNGSRNKI